MFNHLKVKIYPSNRAHNLKWKNVISVNTAVYEKEEINSYYPLLILDLSSRYQLSVK